MIGLGLQSKNDGYITYAYRLQKKMMGLYD